MLLVEVEKPLHQLLKRKVGRKVLSVVEGELVEVHQANSSDKVFKRLLKNFFECVRIQALELLGNRFLQVGQLEAMEKPRMFEEVR